MIAKRAIEMRCGDGPSAPTEAEIEAALRAVPTVCGILKHPVECRETGCMETGFPDYPAMTRAIVALMEERNGAQT